ncbi:hypothetical protein EI94DRAFT_1733782, partial [Lactarius quietus]
MRSKPAICYLPLTCRQMPFCDALPLDMACYCVSRYRSLIVETQNHFRFASCRFAITVCFFTSCYPPFAIHHSPSPFAIAFCQLLLPLPLSIAIFVDDCHCDLLLLDAIFCLLARCLSSCDLPFAASASRTILLSAFRCCHCHSELTACRLLCLRPWLPTQGA